MLAFRLALLALNLLLALVFVVDYFVVDAEKAAPTTKARIGVLLGVLFFTFLVLLLMYAVVGVVLTQRMPYLVLLTYVAIPFAIGKFVSFRTLRFYAALQLLAFLLSAATLYCLH